MDFFLSAFVLWLGLVGLAPLASYSFATAQKSNQKRPSLQLRPWETGCPFGRQRYHAAPELAHVEKQVGSDMLAQKTHDNAADQMAC